MKDEVCVNIVYDQAIEFICLLSKTTSDSRRCICDLNKLLPVHTKGKKAIIGKTKWAVNGSRSASVEIWKGLFDGLLDRVDDYR